MLRDEAITHMAQAIWEWGWIATAPHTPSWESLPNHLQEGYREQARFLMDGHLDFLDAHTEELAEGVVIAWGGTERANEAHWYDARLAAPVLVAALRGTTKEQ